MEPDYLNYAEYYMEYESPWGDNNCTVCIDDILDELWLEFISDKNNIYHVETFNSSCYQVPGKSIIHSDVFSTIEEVLTPLQIIAIFRYTSMDAEEDENPFDRKHEILKEMWGSDRLLDYEIYDYEEFRDKIEKIHPLIFLEFTNILYKSEAINRIRFRPNIDLEIFERKLCHAIENKFVEGRIDIIRDSYTVLESTNPELISTGSTFANETTSEFVRFYNNQAHFLTKKNTMDVELLQLSRKYPGEIFTAERQIHHAHIERFIYCFEYQNGYCKEVSRKPGYLFFESESEIPNMEEYSAFQDHVLQYLKRLDIINEEKGFMLDKLNNEKNRYGYESYITITYENEQYRWTAEKKGISHIHVRVEKKMPKICLFEGLNDEMRLRTNEEYDDLPT